MEDILTKDREYIVLSSVVTNATRCVITDIDADNFTAELFTDEKYKEGEHVTFFSTAGSGLIYFESKIISVNEKKLNFASPSAQTVIQRREYTRIEFNKNILLIDENRNIRSTIRDISAGGMSITTKEKLVKNKNYRADINLEKNISVSCNFKPIRIDLTENGTYNISGRFSLIKNLDRIALAQFCMKNKEESENINK